MVVQDDHGQWCHGKVEPVAIDRVPTAVLALASKSARCIGLGLYGVDIKETSRGPMVIEVNDNPDMDCDFETVANPEAWARLAYWFREAIDRQAHEHPRYALPEQIGHGAGWPVSQR